MTVDPFTGRWTFIPDRSKTSGPPPTVWTHDIQASADRFVVRETMTSAGGQAIEIAIDAKFDGREYPVVGSPFLDAIEYLRPSRHRIEARGVRNGRTLLNETATVSADGQELTINFDIRARDGVVVSTVAVFARVVS